MHLLLLPLLLPTVIVPAVRPVATSSLIAKEEANTSPPVAAASGQRPEAGPLAPAAHPESPEQG
jgi:hypothetical protein